MKVYAEFLEDDGIQFRTKTLLQFDDSWDLIGSIVMKNPGSALPEKNINNETKEKISSFYDEQIILGNWHEFKPDTTMRRIEAIFNGKHIGSQRKLSGIIQIFNLFNIREKDISKAKILANTTSSEYLYPNTKNTIKLFGSKPVYLGFYWEYLNKKNSEYEKKVNSFATEIFDYIKKSKFMYLENDMIDNFFYHPICARISNQNYLPVLEKFFKFYTA